MSLQRLGHIALLLLVGLIIFGCASGPKKSGGGYYQKDGPGANPPANIDAIPDAVPRVEAIHRSTTKPYSVLGKDYQPMTQIVPFHQSGVASWYGRQFHGAKTAIGETYDMYAMTAAHPTLPLPSYAEVRNPANGKRVVVRVNDRGPFYPGRIMDLSYAAAYRLGLLSSGSGAVELTLITPDQYADTPMPPASLPKITPEVGQPAHDPAAGPTETTAIAAAWGVQLGAFANFDNADNFSRHINLALKNLRMQSHVFQRQGRYRVIIAPLQSEAEARNIQQQLQMELNQTGIILPPA